MLIRTDIRTRDRRRKQSALLALGVFAAVSFARAENALSRKACALEVRSAQTIERWEAARRLTPAQALNPKYRPDDAQAAGPELFWRGQRTVWLRAKLPVPDALFGRPIAGSSISFGCEVQDYGEIYVDGVLKSQFRGISGEVELTNSAHPGSEIFIALKISNPINLKGIFKSVRLRYGALADLDRRIHDFRATADVIDALEPFLPLPPEVVRSAVAGAASALDEDALAQGRLADFRRSLDASRAALLPLGPALKTFRFFLLAYSHIDLAWLWTKDEGENVVWKRTSETMLETLARFPGLIYAAGQMHAYRWMERDYPDLFARIREAVRSGRWEPVGAQWVESDGNIPSGESFVRQFLYGRKYSLEKFGRAGTIAFLPDTFGFNAQLPQILAKSGMRGFVTWRVRRTDTTAFPYRLFWWRAPDGSRVLANVLPGRYDDPLYSDEMARQMAEMRGTHGSTDDLVIFGKGDHGSGIPPDYLDRAAALRNDPIFPRVEFATAETAFNAYDALNARRPLPTWNDELYLQLFRGIYTTQAEAKDRNRRNEILLGAAEMFSSAASAASGRAYPGPALEEAWKDLLFNQFHDILPGTSVAAVYRDERADSARIAAEGERRLGQAWTELAASADTTGPGRPIVIFNALSWARGGLVEVALPKNVRRAAVFDERGREIPVQVVAGPDGAESLAFATGEIPAVGLAVYRIRDGAAASPVSSGATARGTTIENESLRVTVDPVGGGVTEIWDKRTGRDVLPKGRVAFELQAYQEIFGSNAWTPLFLSDGTGIMPPEGSRFKMPPPGRVDIVENGPVRATITVERRFGRMTSFRTRIFLVRGTAVVYAVIDADWREKSVFLKCAFPLAADTDRATYEIPYGVIDRATRPRSAEDAAKWEVCGQRWADLTDRSGGFGAALLSFSNYGYDAKKNVLRLTLLRGTSIPDSNADIGPHRIPLALYPHAGTWETAAVSRRAAEYNDPLRVVETAAHPGAWGSKRTFFSADPANVHLTAVKRAEDGRGWIARVVNWGRRGENAVLRLPGVPVRVTETDLIERDLRPGTGPGGPSVRFAIGPQEIKTFRIEF